MNIFKVVTLFLVFFLFSSLGLAGNFAGKRVMNGISYEDYEDFEKNWEFVTVRYRMDNNEQRFIWGNKAAMKTLRAGKTDYPEGSVFAKIGFATEEDVTFPSSKVPSGARRYQFMVRNKKKYAETGGWGYALFDGDKRTFDENPKQKAKACYTCHKLVEKNRGQVFAQLIDFSSFRPQRASSNDKKRSVGGVVRFKTVALSALSPLVRKNLPNVESIRSVQGALRKNVFRGTIDEIRPSLIIEARKSGLPAALISISDAQFGLIYPDKHGKSCSKGKSYKSVFSTIVPSTEAGASPYTVVASQNLCI